MACAAMALGLAATVQAAQINGSIGFTGAYTQNDGTPGNLLTSTSMHIGAVAITPGSVTGDLLGGSINGFPSTIYVNGGIAANFPNIGSTGNELWAVFTGSKQYSFWVTSETQDSLSTTTQLNLSGIGYFSDGIAADNTYGTWQLGFGQSGTPPIASFTFQTTSATNVPDGGTTVALLGAALSGLALIRRKLA